MKTIITVCDTCKKENWDPEKNQPRDGEVLAQLVESAANDLQSIEVRRQSCLMGCERACNIAIQSADKLQYVLGRFDANADDAKGIIDYALLYNASETGQVPYKTWPQAIKGHFVARLPILPKPESDQ
ncbi:hypothetical protein GCM10008927_22420 [Amylibacter ulvae]|uniref:Metal-binding protein n=1 Tax=Paramylibacter ulvae TaxID=1651968 RepID=A0ABQ3D739_9RHOB|nr:DUF1636 domain-containing protein [Amylibacter ulvae]GHA56191.1 hypothetical protein GCM10008927_22420 [Amylibacter ulvae]